ncbi:hypothetical protein D3C73_1400740 [compost metagenome]
MGGVDDPFHKPENRWIVGLVQIGDSLVHTVGCHRVLNQIVGPDTEEIHFLGEEIR